MRAIGYIGLVLVIIGIIGLVFGATIIVGKEKENTFHWVAVGLGVILSIIGLIMVIVGGSRATLKNYKWISVPINMADNIEASIKSYLKGGPKPCFIDAPDLGPGMWSRFKSGLSNAYSRIRRGRNGGTVEVGQVEMVPVVA